MVDIETFLYDYTKVKVEIKILKSELEILENDYRGVGNKQEDNQISIIEHIEFLNDKILYVDNLLELLPKTEVQFINFVYFKRKIYLDFCEELFYTFGWSIGRKTSFCSNYKSYVINRLECILKERGDKP